MNSNLISDQVFNGAFLFMIEIEKMINSKTSKKNIKKWVAEFFPQYSFTAMLKLNEFSEDYWKDLIE